MCVQVAGVPAAIDPTDHLSELPAVARDLLAGAPQLHNAVLVDLDPAGMSDSDPSGYCYKITTAEARELAITLDQIAVPGRESDGIYAVSNGHWLSRWPVLPHGVPAFTGA
jgi:hypothetical protein